MSLEHDFNEDDEIYKEPGSRLRRVDVLHKKRIEEKPSTVTIVFSGTHKEEVPIENVGGKRVYLTDKVNP